MNVLTNMPDFHMTQCTADGATHSVIG